MKRALHFATKLNFKGASFMSRIQVHKGPRNYNVQPHLVEGGVGGVREK